MPYQCCYCEKEFNGKNTYAIPEDYPTNKAHELKPLCGRCGGRETPTLDEICEKLDNDLRKDRAPWRPVFASRGATSKVKRVTKKASRR
jgi:hypothetical protein